MSEINSKKPLQPIHKPVRFWLGMYLLYLLMGDFASKTIVSTILMFVFDGNTDLVKEFGEHLLEHSERRDLVILVQGVSNFLSMLVPTLFFLRRENGLLRFQLSNPINSYGNRKVFFGGGIVILFLPMFSLVNDVNLALFDSTVSFFDLTFLEDYNELRVETYRFLLGSVNFKTLMIAIFWLSVIPAIGEELVFRGVIQNLFVRGLKSQHVAIWISAFLFALIHFEFTGFITRLLVGAMFGYMYFWTKNIYVPIFAHMAFNAINLILGYLATNGVIPEDIVFASSLNSYWWVILLVYSVLPLFLLYRYYQKERVYVIQVGNDSNLQNEAQDTNR